MLIASEKEPPLEIVKEKPVLACGEGCPHCPFIGRGQCSLPKNHAARHMCRKTPSHRW